jgi:hypothetical protein
MPDPREYRLRVGEVVIALVCPDAPFASSLADYFAQASDPAAADITLGLHLVSHDEMPSIPNSLILTKQLTPDGFDIADGLIRGAFDPASGTGDLHVKIILTNGQMTRVFEQILYQAFQSARQRKGYDACLVHSAGVIVDGLGYLFVGPSEAGKSTVATISHDHTVLNDEMNLVEFRPEGPRLVGTPFNGFFRDKTAGAAPLAGILLLEKGPAHRLEAVGAGQAAAAVATQITPPVGLDEVADASTSLAMVDLGARLVTATEVRRLHFTPDAGFWPLLTDALGRDHR